MNGIQLLGMFSAVRRVNSEYIIFRLMEYITVPCFCRNCSSSPFNKWLQQHKSLKERDPSQHHRPSESSKPCDHLRWVSLTFTPPLGPICGFSYSFSGTSVSSHCSILNLLIIFTKIILASNKANLRPTQFRGPAPKGIHASGWRAFFLSRENLKQHGKL